MDAKALATAASSDRAGSQAGPGDVDPKLFARWVDGSGTLKELMGISDKEYAWMAVAGYTMYEMGNLGDALQVYDFLSALDPSRSDIRSTLGGLYVQEGDYQAALQTLTLAIQQDPSDIYAWGNRAELLLRMGRLANAAEDLRRVLALDPDNRHPMGRRGRKLVVLVKDALDRMVASKQAS
ncbi:MAG: tetratricopeptide repeat protein [Candidatus Schekmanbacteria bacterium]|nr:tetratricopeptide repeat protein [Candidatus Schekmanbacteria bacterium]